MREGFLKDIHFFSKKDDSFVAMIVPFLQPVKYEEKDIIYKKNDHPLAIYFMSEGKIYFVNDEFVPYKTMIKGSYFGEIEIIIKKKRVSTVIAAENMDLLLLDKEVAG